MKFVLKLPSLEQMALVKIVTTLWNQDDVRDLIGELQALLFWDTDRDAATCKIKDRIAEKVSQLLLPEELKKCLLGFVMPIGLQIIDWMKFHSKGFNFGIEDRYFCPAELCWTAQGTLDRKRTAEVLVRDENFDIATRYKLACVYCLEESIEKLWYEMPEDLKESFLQEDEGDWSYLGVVYLWTYTMTNRGLGNACISYTSQFVLSAKLGIKVAVEYFLPKLNPREREQCLVKIVKYITDAEVFCLLLSELDEEQQIEIFKNIPNRVLHCFLSWPLQCFFIEIADRVWDTLPIKDFRGLLYKINKKIEYGYTDCDYKRLFIEFWQRSPNALRNLISYEFYTGCEQSILFSIKDKGILSLIFKDTTLPEKKKLIHSVNVQKYCYRLISDDRWDLLECFIKECLPTKDEMMKFKAEFEERSQGYAEWLTRVSYRERENQIMNHKVVNHLLEKKHKWDQVFLSSDDSVCRYNKRSTSESESSSSKRQHGHIPLMCLLTIEQKFHQDCTKSEFPVSQVVQLESLLLPITCLILLLVSLTVTFI